MDPNSDDDAGLVDLFRNPIEAPRNRAGRPSFEKLRKINAVPGLRRQPDGFRTRSPRFSGAMQRHCADIFPASCGPGRS